jgi:Na+-driven multidrug efflux pump
MHKWFLAGMLLAAAITVVLVLIVETVGAAAAVVVAYLAASSVLVWMYFRRRGDQHISWRSRELRCRWPTDATLRRCAAPVPHRHAVLMAFD